ncbi:MAG: 3-methyl-2-oxobutanoate hydroxymethyltransferase [Microthrixaceae bacterium]
MAARTPMTVPAVAARKVRDGADPLVMVTAYDAPGARIADEAGVDMILVGDSLAMVVLGYDDTLQVTIDDMAHHTAAVARAKPSSLIVGDLPWLSYHVSTAETVRNAATLVRGRRSEREARGRPQAGPDDRGDRRRGDPGDGASRPDPPVDACHGRLQGAGP